MPLIPAQLLDDAFYKTVMWKNEQFLPFAYGRWFKNKKGWGGGLQMKTFDSSSEVPPLFTPVALPTGKFYAVAAPYHGDTLRHHSSAEDPAEEVAALSATAAAVLQAT